MAKKSKRVADASLTLVQLSERYLDYMERAGKSNGTCWSYGMELKLAMSEIGAEKLVSEISPADIERFDNCARVVKLKTGKPKSQLSIDKSRRVLRLAFAFALESGLIATSPYVTTEVATEVATPAPVQEPKPAKKRAKREAVVAEESVEVAEAPAA